MPERTRSASVGIGPKIGCWCTTGQELAEEVLVSGILGNALSLMDTHSIGRRDGFRSPASI